MESQNERLMPLKKTIGLQSQMRIQREYIQNKKIFQHLSPHKQFLKWNWKAKLNQQGKLRPFTQTDKTFLPSNIPQNSKIRRRSAEGALFGLRTGKQVYVDSVYTKPVIRQKEVQNAITLVRMRTMIKRHTSLIKTINFLKSKSNSQNLKTLDETKVDETQDQDLKQNNTFSTLERQKKKFKSLYEINHSIQSIVETRGKSKSMQLKKSLPLYKARINYSPMKLEPIIRDRKGKSFSNVSKLDLSQIRSEPKTNTKFNLVSLLKLNSLMKKAQGF